MSDQAKYILPSVLGVMWLAFFLILDFWFVFALPGIVISGVAAYLIILLAAKRQWSSLWLVQLFAVLLTWPWAIKWWHGWPSGSGYNRTSLAVIIALYGHSSALAYWYFGVYKAQSEQIKGSLPYAAVAASVLIVAALGGLWTHFRIEHNRFLDETYSQLVTLLG